MRTPIENSEYYITKFSRRETPLFLPRLEYVSSPEWEYMGLSDNYDIYLNRSLKQVIWIKERNLAGRHPNEDSDWGTCFLNYLLQFNEFIFPIKRFVL